MTINFVSSNPLQGAVNVPLTTTIQIVLETTAAFNISTLNVTIIQENLNPVQAVVNGLVQSGFVLNTNIIGSQLEFTVVSSQPFNSYKNIIINYQISDGTSFSGQLTFKTIDVNAPVYLNFSPEINSEENGTASPIFFQIKDTEGIDLTTLNIYVKSTVNGVTDVVGLFQNGIPIYGFDTEAGRGAPQIIQNGDTYSILLFMSDEFESGAVVTIESSVQDSYNSSTISYDFTIIDIESPKIEASVPVDGQINVNENTTITFTIDDSGTGIDDTKVNVKVNGIAAIVGGVPTNGYLVTIIPSGTAEIYTLVPPEELESATTYTIEIQAADLKKNVEIYSYSFATRNYKSPKILDFFPQDGYSDIQPHFNVQFKVKEDPLSSLRKLTIEINDEEALNLEGEEEFYSRVVYRDSEIDGYWNVVNRGFKVEIQELETNEYVIIVDPMQDYQFNEAIVVDIFAEDDGYLGTAESYNFQITDKLLITEANPKGGKYKNFLDGDDGIELTCNYPDCRIFYTLDGTVPKVDSFGIVQGTTRYYDGRKILLNREGQHIIKFFSIDSAGTKEDTKQETYIITPFPPDVVVDKIVYLASDVVYPTRIITVENTFLLKSGQMIKVLDDVRSPVYTKIVSVNSTASPQYITVEKEVEKLSVSRKARIEIQEEQIDINLAIDFDTTKLEEKFYIGSDSNEENQADSIIEELRILNRASTAQEVEADYKILQKGSTFYCAEESVDLGDEFSDLENARANLVDNTLVLLDFNGSIDNKGMLGALKKDQNPVIDKNVANNIVLFTIRVQKGKFIDRELLKKVLRNFTPIDLDIIVEFEEVE